MNQLGKGLCPATSKMLRYLMRVGTATSVWFNVVTGGASNQTFSARNWHWAKQGKWNMVWLIDLILGEDHCAECWVYWKVREDKW